MTILERLKDAEVEIKALLQDLEEERGKTAKLDDNNHHLRDCYDIQNRSFTEKIQRLEDQLKCRNERCDALEMTAARLQNEVIFERKKVADLERQLSERATGRDWWIVPVRFEQAAAFTTIQSARRHHKWMESQDTIIHVREVVNVDYYPEPQPGKVEDVKHFNRTLTPEEVKVEYEQSSYGIRSVTQWPVSPEPLWTPFTDLADGWFHIDAIQIIDYDWRYAGWTDGTRRYGPICCTGPLTTLDTVSLLDEWGNDLLTWEGMQKHCSDISKRLEETNNNRNEAWARYGDVCRTNVTLETRLEHAMKLLRDISEIFKKGWHPSIELQVRVKELIAKYKESPLDVPNPQGEQLKKAMELLAELDRSWRRGYVESVQFDKVKALVEKYGEGGDDE